MEQDSKAISYFEGLARAASARGGARFSRFLDPAQRKLAQDVAHRLGVTCTCYGGYPGAERAMAAFHLEALEEGFPIACLEAAWSRHAPAPAHRDLLGAQMGLGLDRGCFGDILVGSDRAYLYVTGDVAGYVIQNYVSAGKTPLCVKEVNQPDAQPEPQGTDLRVTVGSMRLDALVAAAWNLSRAQAQALIGRELVKLNHAVCPRGDAKVAQGDLISCRGMGRAQVVAEDGMTRKGRLAVQLFIYGNN